MKLRTVGHLVIALMFATTAQSAEFSDPEWPCVQRKVLNLSTGQMWAGPPIEESAFKEWRKDPAIATLAPLLSIRRTTDEQAQTLIAEFGEKLGDERDAKLSLLFAGVFTLIERERSEIITGIGRYAKTQTALTASIEKTQNRLTQLRKAEDLDYDTIEELEDKVTWDTRIYKDRAQSLTYVCETPVILEKRTFAIARLIMAQLD